MAETAQTLPSDAQLFRDIFNASPIGIAVENLEGQPLFVNPALCSMLGFSEQELCTKHCVEFSPPEEAEKDWLLFQQLRAGSIDHYQLEKRYFRRDGSLVWGRLSISLWDSRPSPLVVAMVEDITDKKKTEETQLRHAAVIESSEDAIASGTMDGIIVSWNTGAQKIYGYTEAEAVGKPISMLVPPELPDEENKILERLKSGDRIEHFETVRVTKTGKRINVSLTISPIKDSTGRTVGISGIARDITERKRHEQKLQEYERAVEHSGEMITVIDREYRCVMANRQYLSLKNLSRDQVVGHFAYELLDQATFEQVAKPKLDECFRGKVVKYQLKYTYPTIGERVLSISYFPIEGPNGVDRVTCLLQDITERKRAEDMLKESRETLRSIFDSTPDSITVVDLDGRIKLCNQVTAHIHGFSSVEQLIGKSVFELIAEEDRQRAEEIKRHVMIQGIARDVLFTGLKGNGEKFPAELSFALLKDASGRPTGFVGITSDITERKRAEAALRVSEVKYSTVVELTGTGYVVVDSQGRVLDANQEYVHLSGHGALREILGRSVIEWTAEGAKQPNAEAVAQCAKDRSIRNFVTEYVDGKGQATFIEVNATVEGEGEALRIVALCRNVTERVRREQVIRDLSGRLISAQEEERSRIARELHDDLNQRMALLAIELDRWNQQLPPSAVEFHDHIHHAIQRLSDIAKDIQALSHRLHSSKLEYLGIVAAAKSFCKELSEQQKVEIDFSHTAIPRSVPKEISLCLFRVLQETLQNAVKHSGVRHFKVELHGTEGEIQLTVSDLGVGFDPQDAIHRRGLGLISMRERIQLVSGEFSIKSQPGSGTTIHARVPFGSSSDSAPAG